MSIGNAVLVNGWMLSTELEWLATQAKRRKLIVEIGSWMGRSTRALADSTRGKVIAVDTFFGSDEPEHHRILDAQPEDWLLKEFKKNLAEHIITGKVEVCQNTSLDAAKYLNFAGEKFDMIFIDAAHDYESVKADILAWMPLLAPGGLLCGHDFKGAATGVQRAVEELVPDFKRVTGGSLWYR